MTWNTAETWLTHLHPDRWSGALIILALFVLAGLLLSHLLKRAIRLIVARDHDNRLDRMSIGFLSKVASAFVWIMILMFYAHMIPALDRLATALLASVSVASVVFGLAAQSTLSNFVAGFSLRGRSSRRGGWSSPASLRKHASERTRAISPGCARTFCRSTTT